MKNKSVFVVIFFSYLLLACSSSGKKGASGKKVIGVSMLSLQNEFVVNLKDALEEAAKDSNVKLIITDAQRSAEKQVQQIETFISQGVDAIILNPCEVDASSPAVDRAKNAGIPIVNVNSETRSNPDAFVGSNDREAGAMAMEYIAKALDFKGNVLIMDGYIGQAAQIKRSNGAKKVLEKYPDMKVLAEQSAEWDRAKAMSLMENWIQTYGNRINAVFAQNDEMGMGAVQALEQAHLKEQVVVVSIDAIADALDAVKNGRLDATLYQDAKGQASGALKTALQLANHEKNTTAETFIPFQLITRSNVDSLVNAQAN